MAFAVCTRMNGKDKSVVCSHCQRTRHEDNSCFALIGYPDWWGDKPRGDAKSGGHSRGQQSSQQRIEKGVGRGRGAVKIYAAQASPGSTTTAGVSKGNDFGSLGLSTDQLQGLLLNNQKNSSSNPEKMTGKQVSWIIDTGAPNHMTGILNNLHNL